MWYTQIVIWNVQGLPQSNDAAYPMQQEDKETTQKANKPTNNRNLIMHTFKLSSLTVMVKIHAASSKLWQELSQSMNETLAFI